MVPEKGRQVTRRVRENYGAMRKIDILKTSFEIRREKMTTYKLPCIKWFPIVIKTTNHYKDIKTIKYIFITQAKNSYIQGTKKNPHKKPTNENTLFTFTFYHPNIHLGDTLEFNVWAPQNDYESFFLIGQKQWWNKSGKVLNKK